MNAIETAQAEASAMAAEFADPWISVRKLSLLTGTSVWSIRKDAKAGKLHVDRFSPKRWRIRLSEAKRYAREAASE